MYTHGVLCHKKRVSSTCVKEDINLGIQKRKFEWIWSLTEKRWWGNTKGRLILEPSEKQEERKTKK
jgi:hypothetical protein